MNRILGYYVIINADKPRSIPSIKKYIESKNFKGLNETLVIREINKVFVHPKINQHIITHELSKEESLVYITMKKILMKIKDRVQQAKLYDNIEDLKKFNSYKLVMILYLRQSLICPLIPITSVSLNICNIKEKSELSKIIVDELKNNGLNEWMDSVESVKSSSIKETIRCIDNHQNEKVIVFCSFKSFFDILRYYLKDSNRPRFTITATMNIKNRQILLKNFRHQKTGYCLQLINLVPRD